MSRWQESDISLIREFLDNKKSIGFIASHFGITPNNLKVVMHRHNLFVRDKSQNRDNTLIQIKNKQKQPDLSSRIRILKGEELRTSEPTHFFSDDQIKRWLNGVDGVNLFCKEVLKVELQDYQLQMVEKMLNNKRFVGILGRQSGKDFCITCFTIWVCITQSNSKILLVSPAQRQSSLLFERILNFIGRSNELFDSVKKSNLEMAQFENNSEIYNLPSTSFIRGFTEVTHIIVNESCHGISDDTIQSVLIPMLSIKNGSLILLSTPSSCQGYTWNAFNNPIFAKIQQPSNVNKYINESWLNEQKNELPALVYDSEINAQFQQSLDNFFSSELIESCSQEYSLRKTMHTKALDFYLGVDWGRIKDSSVLTIVSKDGDLIRIENVIELNNKPFSEQVKLIKLLHKQYCFKKLVVEWGGLGIMPSEQLRESIGSDVIIFKPTTDEKIKAFNYLLKQMEDGNVIIPKDHKKIQYELRVFNYKVNDKGQMLLHHISGGSDDFVDSLCYAVWATKQQSSLFMSFSR